MTTIKIADLSTHLLLEHGWNTNPEGLRRVKSLRRQHERDHELHLFAGGKQHSHNTNNKETP